MKLDDLPTVLSQFAMEKPVRAKLYRQADDGEAVPIGVDVILGTDDGKMFIELHGIEGELPANIRIEDDTVKISPDGEPGAWQSIEGADAAALRVFSLLDPRRFAGQLHRVNVVENARDGYTYAVGHVDLLSWQPRLPEAFVTWLRADAHDRPIVFRFEGSRLAEVIQPDLYPRREDRIVERFD